jgi:hypothetical protein
MHPNSCGEALSDLKSIFWKQLAIRISRRGCSLDEKADRDDIYTLKIFISYAHTDQKLRKKLEEHLSSLTRSNTISIWQDQVILAGGDWNYDIQEHLKEADVVLLLVSARFIASNYCWDREVEKTLERHKAGTVQVIPF